MFLGANYGWPLVSRGAEYGTIRCIGVRDPMEGMTDPVLSWEERLLAGGLAGRSVAVLDPERRREVVRLLSGWGRNRDVRTDAAGCVYLLADAADARLLRLAPGAPPARWTARGARRDAERAHLLSNA